MSQSRIRCPNCPEIHFSTLVEAVQHVMTERGPSKQVQCCVEKCPYKVRKLRQHIRKIHKEFCLWPCSACHASFVGRKDLKNHYKDCRKLACVTSVSLGLKSKDIIETFFENIDFRDSSAVNKFITNELELDEASRKEFSEVVDRLCKRLQPSFSINKLVKGGSVGKGTAVKGKADIDCVVFLNNVNTMKEHKRHLPKTKKRLKLCLNQSPDEDQITFEKDTPFAVKFNFHLDSSREFDIDLLPTFTTVKRPEQLYNEMIEKSKMKDLDYYSAHFVSLQKEFVKGQESIVKNLIRLVKYWRKTCIEDKSNDTARLPSSYPLELITIGCWENAGKPLPFDIRAGFKAVLEQLVDKGQIHFIWYNYYSEAMAKSGIKRMKPADESFSAFVLDPANPTNNVCITSRDETTSKDAEGWEIVKDVANKTIERQPLKDIIVNEKWEII